jgi:hypothetical protein
MTDTILKVGDKVKIKHLLSWGACEIIAIYYGAARNHSRHAPHKYVRKIRYAVTRPENEGITDLLGLKKKQLEKIEE